MGNLDHIYKSYIENFKIVVSFISENFGNKNILIRKNQGLIPNRNFKIQNSKIKGYVFHGTGCDFILKDYTIDIELNNDHVGFTNWSFYMYAKNINGKITEIEIKKYLKEMVNNNYLLYNGKVFELN